LGFGKAELSATVIESLRQKGPASRPSFATTYKPITAYQQGILVLVVISVSR